ncbi:CheC domain protein OS=Hippea maritima (strain ATCC 700847 / DSM 10411 / MH2) GN=Hipma_0355 PE=4 SV=1: CheX [Gemmata massiliana]|uniref:Chemotaxis phosphatase CheX-like domain-containing protein n=1 Tax=Gemmata massiliana TaxID=1210884 RepID=A0A6P2D6G3_9BACT|nr:chemotaxis protein CheX [Gemmata massiliana]VTR96901.1 CheC domain protein OS=Hippea maritima (strain ATCC 700847 / DSM 10411 / MH2) GN=Hipma_0355 PE=4 SV=1: CheX [Gemmata massiliana]
MAETLAAAMVFPPVVSKAVEESAAAFFKSSCNMTHVPNGTVDENDLGAAGIMSTISFMGDPPWAFAMAFPEESAVTIAKVFAGFEIEFDSPDMGDLVGEIANVIAGDITARLHRKGIKAPMSLPTVVRGSNVSLLTPTGGSSTRLVYAGPGGTCWFNLVGTRTDGVTFRRPGM